jgi:aminoglycoside 6'-N-acetyltransferase I
MNNDNPTIHCEQLPAEDEAIIEEVARISQAAFSHIPYCDTLAEALEEVREALEPGKICLVAHDEQGRILGWVGGQHSYSQVWELHPLAVDPRFQRRGVGRALVLELEKRIQAAGGYTIQLGTDDEFGGTNLYGRELYPNVLEAAQAMRNVADHPFTFYEKLGYVVTGLIPDANGFGKPDIVMCKRVGLEARTKTPRRQGKK